MKKTAIILLLFHFTLLVKAQDIIVREANAIRTKQPPKIDGILEKEVWDQAESIGDFHQFIPDYKHKASFPTDVKIIFDNEAVYIAAKMLDNHPDSILRQLGNRDDDDLNADYFSVNIDCYNNQLDAFAFRISASGVQSDYRILDNTYDAVWQSAVNIDKEGWTAELKIPYSALRFPAIEVQQWRMQLLRYVRRYRELDQWCTTVKEAPNSLVYWGKLKGIENVKPVTRLSLTPYLTSSYENYPLQTNGKDDNSYSISGGMDLKYGLDESFTLDMSLLPDFSQVRSDDPVKNLSAFETVYDEQRPFFEEAVDLFTKGDLFYSRRIGRLPMNFYSIENQLSAGEKITKNPPAAKLLNATKLSGRNKHGLALGIFNALTDNTYATVEDMEGNTRKILTDPRTNYNIIVFDQALKNNSSFYLINTNTIRDKGYKDANVTGSGISIFTKNNLFKINAQGALSQLYSKVDTSNNLFTNNLGFKYDLSIGKVKGNYQAAIYSKGQDDHFSANDMGLTLHNNNLNHGVSFNYYQHEPKGIFRESSIGIEYNIEQNYLTGKTAEAGFTLSGYTTLTNYLSLWNEILIETEERYDYYEPRVKGRYFIKPKFWGFEQGFSSDYRKPLALDGRILYYSAPSDAGEYYEFILSPLVRMNDHLFFTYSFRWMLDVNDIGYVGTTENSDVILGVRDVDEIENSFTGRYLFNNHLSLNLRFRQYWSKGKYSSYHYLQDNGYHSESIFYPYTSDFNFNAFNVDLLLWWEFAPGSRLNLVWKNSITKEDNIPTYNFWNNFKDTWESPQDNTFTIKLLYYLDYQTLKKLKKSK